MYSTQEERHSSSGIEFETALKTDSIALPISILVGLADSVGLNNYIMGLMILLQQKRHIKLMKMYQINNELDDSLEAFNVLYQIGDSIGDEFNGKGRRYFELLLLSF